MKTYEQVFVITKDVLDTCKNDEEIKNVLDYMAKKAAAKAFEMIKQDLEGE